MNPLKLLLTALALSLAASAAVGQNMKPNGDNRELLRMGLYPPDILMRNQEDIGITGEQRKTIANLVRESYASFPDLEVRCDMMRWAGTHAIFVWTREGHHAETGNHVVTRGWEEWELTPDYLVQSSLGWFDADDHQRQIDGA